MSISELGGLVYGLTIGSLMFWLGAAFVAFSGPVAAWFRRRQEAAKGLAVFGTKSAAANMSRGQVMFFGVASMIIIPIILLNVSPQVAEQSTASAPLVIFLGAAGLVGGIALAVGVARRRWRFGTTGLAAGVVIALLGLLSIAGGIALALSAPA